MTSPATADRADTLTALVEVVGVSKRFAAVQALDGVGFAIQPGTVHALIGENGAGKSTLGKIIAGVIQPDGGHLQVRGETVHLSSPREALRHGIATIEQEISLVPGLSVQDNVFLGAEPTVTGLVSRRELAASFESLREASGFKLAPDDRVRDLSLGDRQQVEIMRALSRRADLIVMDEPTAALNEEEVEALHRAIRAVVDRGATVLIVTHFLKEVLRLADMITVLRDGKHVRTGPAARESEDSLVRAMLGRDLSAVFPEKDPVTEDSRSVLQVRHLRAAGVVDVSLTVRSGEVVGLAGLDGSGRAELARALYGDLEVVSGQVDVQGSPLGRPSPRRSLAAGLAMIPASRRDDGLFLERPTSENVSIGTLRRCSRAGFVRRKLEARNNGAVLTRLGIPVQRWASPVATLSGGNQQKVMFARALTGRPAVLIAHEPTRGVDIGAKAAIYALIAAMAREGVGILLISSEPEELIGLSHRVLVMRHGSVVAELVGDDIAEERILTAALTGVAPERTAS